MAYRVLWAPNGQAPTLLRHSMNHKAALAYAKLIKSVPSDQIVVEEYHPSVVDHIAYGRQYRIVNEWQGYRQTIMAGMNKAAADFWLPSCQQQFKGAKIEPYETARIEFHSDCDCQIQESRLLPTNQEEGDAVLSGKGLASKVPEGMRITSMGHFIPEANKYTPGQYLPAIAGDKPVKLGYINTAHVVPGYVNHNVGVKSAVLPKEKRPSKNKGLTLLDAVGYRTELPYGTLIKILRDRRITAKQLRYYLSGVTCYKNRYGEYFYRFKASPGFKPLGDSQIKRITRDIQGW